MLKKLLSLSLVITMILTLGMTAVFADGETTTTVISSNTFNTGTLSGLGGKEVNDNSQAVTNASYHANYIYQSYKTGYFTFEFSVLGVDTTDYKLTGTIYSSDLRSDNKNERVSKEFVAELPKLNEWHRVAFEFYRDENATTPKATVKFYVDGVQVSAVALSELPLMIIMILPFIIQISHGRRRGNGKKPPCMI